MSVSGFSGRWVAGTSSHHSVLRGNKSKSLFSLGRKQSLWVQPCWFTVWGFSSVFSFQVHCYPPFSKSISTSYYFTLKCFMPFSIFSSLILKDQESNIFFFFIPWSMKPETLRKWTKSLILKSLSIFYEVS